ncbi:lipopolysaccharide biosynthesis protein [Rhodovibrionaceae bacterium A322]
MTAATPASHDSNLLRSSLLGAAIIIGNFLLLYLTDLLLARWLGAADLGDWSVAKSLALVLANLAGLGTLQTLPKFLPLYQHRGEVSQIKGFLQDNFSAIMLFSFVIALSGYGFFLLLQPDGLEHPIGLIWIAMPLIAVGEFSGNLLLASHRPLTSSTLILLIWPGLTLALAAGFEFYGDDKLQDTEMLWAWVGGLILVLPFLLRSSFKALPAGLFQAETKRDRKEWIKVGGPLLASGFLYLLLNQVSLFILEDIGSERDVGVFAVVTQTALFIAIPTLACLPVIIPHFPGLLESGDKAGLKKLVRTTMALVALAAGTITFLIIFFGHPILAWFGPEFAKGYDALVALCLFNFGIIILKPLWPLLAAAGHEKQLAPITLVAVLINVAVCYALVPSLGTLAASLGQGIAILGIHLYLLWFIKFKTDVDL